MRLSHEIAAEQVKWWRENGVTIADAVASMGQVVRGRHVGRTWVEVEQIVVREWWDAMDKLNWPAAA